MNIQSNTGEKDVAPELRPTPTWTLERRIAMLIVGKLGFEGELSDEAISDDSTYLNSLIEMVADAIKHGLDLFGGEGDLKQILADAENYRLGRRKPGAE